jgi:hypothetical protein
LAFKRTVPRDHPSIESTYYNSCSGEVRNTQGKFKSGSFSLRILESMGRKSKWKEILYYAVKMELTIASTFDARENRRMGHCNHYCC